MDNQSFLDSNPDFYRVKEIYNNYKKDKQLLDEILPTQAELASFITSYNNLFIQSFIIICANSFECHLVNNLAESLCKERNLLSNFITKQSFFCTIWK